MRDFTIKSEPFSWNADMSGTALEDFSMIQKTLPYGTCQSIGMALAKLQIMERQGLKIDEKQWEQDEKLRQWIETHDGEDYCHYCIFDDDCPHGITCYGGPTIEPPCCGKDLLELLDTEAILADLEEQANG